MGAVRPTEEANGNKGIEITYGGKESPFGGVDTSAPPAYIAPNCFAAADGFLVIDNKLVAASLQPYQTPTLWKGQTGVAVLGFGTFYQTGYGQINYALGYKATQFGTPGTTPTGVDYVFYITTWNPQTPTSIMSDVSIDLTLFDSFYPSTVASITLDCISSGAAATAQGSGATATIDTTTGPPSNQATSATVSGGTGYSAGAICLLVQTDENLGAVGTIASVSGGGAITGFSLINPSGINLVVGAAALIVLSASNLRLVITGPNGTNTYTVPASGSSGTFTRQYMVGAMVTAINGGSDPNVFASVSADGYSLILTSKITGSAGNAITVQDTSNSSGTGLPPAFYFACRVADDLSGGEDLVAVSAPRFFTTASIAEVGGTIYIANIGPIILKYTEPGVLKTSTLYQGVSVLRKFAGSLLGLRLTPQLGLLVQNTDMILAWSGANNLDEWAPVTLAGNVTGAGFEQLDDIGDFLAGLIVSSGTAFIIRAQGISYATATGNALNPFPVNHIGLGDQGEGSQFPALICQYNETGVFVGNSNIFQISGSITAIGEKIKAALFQALNSVTGVAATNLANSASCAVFIGGDVFPIAVIGVSTSFGFTALQSFVYNATNGTWMPLTYQNGVGIGAINKALLSPISTLGTNAEQELLNQTQLAYCFQQQISNVAQTPAFFTLQEGVPNANSISNQAAIVFPQEEIVFGRDITYDSLYVALWANVSSHTFIDFYINNVLYATLDLDPAVWDTLSGNPTQVQVFPLSSYGAGAVTGTSMQLSYKVRSLSGSNTALIRFSKIMLLGSLDPNQRPT